MPTLILLGFLDPHPWQSESYTTISLPAPSVFSLTSLTDDLESSEPYCILSTGASCVVALTFALSPSRQCVLVSAHDPPSIPPGSFHPSIHLLIHLPLSAPFSPAPACNVEVRVLRGEAQAFARTLAAVRAAVGPRRVDLESVVGEPREGRGWRFVDRVVGVDKVVDEWEVTWVHDEAVEWCGGEEMVDGREKEARLVRITGVKGGRVVGQRWVTEVVRRAKLEP